jgi:uncharacterized protein YjiS (DUF1127 family)
MSVLQFAVASLVDANTGNELVHRDGKIDYAAAEQRGRVIRSNSVRSLFASIKRQVAELVENHREGARQRRELNVLLRLNDYHLRDIGLTRGDLFAAEMGQVTLAELDAHRNKQQTDKASLANVEQIGLAAGDLTVANEAFYDEAKCA